MAVCANASMSMPGVSESILDGDARIANEPYVEKGQVVPSITAFRALRSEALDTRCATQRSGASTARGDVVRVRVVARVRPLLSLETAGLRQGANCIDVASPCVSVGKSCFSFDHVFGEGSTQEEVYEECVDELVEATFEGINGTLLAYGQTGSGKTYTMGTGGLPSEPHGAVQRAISAIFARARDRLDDGTTNFRVSFVEIFTSKNTEEIRDLLAPGRSQVFATIKADLDGQVRLEGVVEHEVFNEQEALTFLALGSTARATCSTRMNESSSRSHAIFSLEVIQRRLVSGVPSTFTAKFQFVDLAGSEKVKHSGVEGEQLSQAININHGLFVLGKVITALTEGQPHIPFRESKLTRILQNSLGGNSRTCMVACVSPCDSNLAETISTLTYAAKAKEIKNKPVVNRGLSCPSCATLQAKLEALEGAKSSGDKFASSAIVTSTGTSFRQDCFHPYVMQLEKENVNLRQEICKLRQEQSKQHEGRIERHDGNSQCMGISEKLFNDTKSAAMRAESLYRRCSERLAALQQEVQAAEINVDEELLCPEDSSSEFTLSDSDDETSKKSMNPDVEPLEDGQDIDDQDDVWLGQEARRKQKLLLQVEENHLAMAVLEAQSQERIKQHEAARDIAERELSRVKAELEAAHSRAEKLEKFKILQERYDKRVVDLKEKNQSLEKERKESQRLRALQQRQETRLRVLQDSIRQVKHDREQLRAELRMEVRRRRDQEAQGRRERKQDQAKIRSLNIRLAQKNQSFEGHRKSGTNQYANAVRLRRSRFASGAGFAATNNASKSQPNLRTSGFITAPAPEWQQLLKNFTERCLRERRVEKAKEQVASIEAQVLDASATRERITIEAEVEGAGENGEAKLAAADADLAAQRAALEYHQEQLWLLRRECNSLGADAEGLPAVAMSLAEGKPREELVANLVWLCSEVAMQIKAVSRAHEEHDIIEADFAACRAALLESEHKATELEQAFDVVRGDYESRIAFLLSRFRDSGQVDADDVRDCIGEDAQHLLSRRVAELEDALLRERKESKDKSQRRLEQDMELITNYREQESENKELKSLLKESAATVERTVARGAQREAQLLRQLEKAEAQLTSQDRPPPIVEGSESVEISWVMQCLEDFWRSTGLDVRKEDLVRNLRADVEALCKQRLHDHLEWKKEQEDRNRRLKNELEDLHTILGEEPEHVLESMNLMEVSQHVESCIKDLSNLKESRTAELAQLSEKIIGIHQKLYETPLDQHLPTAGERGALHATTIIRVRERLKALEDIERSREEKSAERISKLNYLWGVLGVEIPEDLDAQELELMQGPTPVSDSWLAYLDARCEHLSRWRDNLEPEESSLQAALVEIQELCEPFGCLSMPTVPSGLPLLKRIKSLTASIQEAECIGREFIRDQRASLTAFYNTAQLQSVQVALQQLDAETNLKDELSTLRQNWQQLDFQRSEHQRIVELICSRETLEAEMRHFDIEASAPDRFKRRGYSGVQENKARADYQRRLRMLDASLGASTSEWLQREGEVFRINGLEYRGAEMLPPEHTHMYAWTGKQMAQASKAASPRSSGETNGPTMGEPPGKRSPVSTPRQSQVSLITSPKSTPRRTSHLTPRTGVATGRTSMGNPRSPQSTSHLSSRRLTR